MLIDRVLEAEQNNENKEFLLERIHLASVVDLQPIIDHMNRNRQDFPLEGKCAIYPKLENAWYEWSLPCDCCGGQVHLDLKQGVHLLTKSLGDDELKKYQYVPPAFHNVAEYFCVGSFFSEEHDGIKQLPSLIWTVGKGGRFLSFEPCGFEKAPKNGKEVATSIFNMMVLFRTFSVLIRDDVQLVRGETPSPNLQKERLKRGLRPLKIWQFPYLTDAIENMKSEKASPVMVAPLHEKAS